VYRIAWLAVAAIAGAVLTVPKFSVSTGDIKDDKGKTDE
jgi:hypothetical protein